ncbi:putative Leucine-rich repeat-containing protein 23 [Hypsibius exemplaris]|uniref:Leucine-rich repeat-containing protein 23 n=1 Tax=Hypsibius exemplaris TaxID=2072580 RepID=A0A9X6NG72_HYPEX|nr:putative Leucine-rich repeat-containing protein 23 [Hypsibius exemplaris]
MTEDEPTDSDALTEEETEEENPDGDAEGAHQSPKEGENAELDDGLVHDLAYYVQKIAKNSEETDDAAVEEHDLVFGSDSDNDLEPLQPASGDTFRPRQMRSLQSGMKKSVAFHERRFRICRTVCTAVHKNFINVDALSDFKYLRCVDFGKNYLRDLVPFSDLPFLGTLKLYKNGMGDMRTLKSRTLRFLDISKNKVQSLEGTSLPRISRLKMNFNRIKSLDFLKDQEMKWLRRLELRGNGLKTTAGIRHQFLEELYLAENDIREVEDLEFCPNLKHLHLRDNQIIEVTGFSKRNAKLEYVNLRNNLVTFIDDAVGVCVLPKIKTLVMLDNPVQLEEDFRMVMIARMPTLTTLDKDPVSQYDRDWSIMLLLDCLHHEEADLMVAVGDMIEKFRPVEPSELVESVEKEARHERTSEDAGPVDDADVSRAVRGLSVSPIESLVVLEDDLDRKYWGEEADGLGEDGEGEDEET